jgi:hypothetical protein
MEQTSQTSDRNQLKNQIKEAYGRVVYSYTTHCKETKTIRLKNNLIKWSLIVLSSLTVCGLLPVIFDYNAKAFSIVSAILAFFSACLSSFSKSANYDNCISSHEETAHELWLIREEYLSLLIDFDSLSNESIIAKRNALCSKLDIIYKHELPVSDSSYHKAQKALKENEEQFFSDDELNKMLPKALRSKD